MKISFLSGEPIQSVEQDSLGFRGFAEHIYNALHHVTTPFVFGLYGDWGSGKSSIVNLLKGRLADGPRGDELKIVPIVIEAWKYDDEDKIIFPLFHALKKKYVEMFPADDDKNGYFWKSLLDVVAASTVALSDLGLRALTRTVTGSSVSLSDVEKSFERVEKEKEGIEGALSEWADQVEQLNEKFQTLIYALAGAVATKEGGDPDKVRFLIVIDDLDRCLPEAALAVLEGIKNHLSVEHCIYLFAINPAVIRRGIEAKYRGAEIDGQEYLEKIVHYAFLMPEPDMGRIIDYAKTQFQAQVNTEQVADLAETLDAIGQCIKELRITNPRRIKRLTNRLMNFVSLLIFDENSEELDPGYLVHFTFLLEYSPDIFNFLLGVESHTTFTWIIDVFDNKMSASELKDKTGLDLNPVLTDRALSRSLRTIANGEDGTGRMRRLAVTLFLFSE